MTTQEVVEFLHGIAQQRSTRYAGLAVGFTHETKFISDQDEAALQHLDELVEAGGTPIGVVGIQQDPLTRQGAVGFVLLPDWREESEVAWAEDIMDRICINFVAVGMASNVIKDFTFVGDHQD